MEGVVIGFKAGRRPPVGGEAVGEDGAEVRVRYPPRIHVRDHCKLRLCLVLCVRVCVCVCVRVCACVCVFGGGYVGLLMCACVGALMRVSGGGNGRTGETPGRRRMRLAPRGMSIRV